MNDILPTPPPGVFDDEPSGWTRPHTPGVASARTINPELRSSPRMASSAPTVITGPVSPAMSETLTQRKREMLKRCTDAAQQLGQPVLFGMTTSLILQSVPLPKDCDIDPAELHTVLRLTPHTNTCHRAANDTTHLEAAERCAQCAYQQTCVRTGSDTHVGHNSPLIYRSNRWSYLATQSLRQSPASRVWRTAALLTAFIRTSCGKSLDSRNSTQNPSA